MMSDSEIFQLRLRVTGNLKSCPCTKVGTATVTVTVLTGTLRLQVALPSTRKCGHWLTLSHYLQWPAGSFNLKLTLACAGGPGVSASSSGVRVRVREDPRGSSQSSFNTAWLFGVKLAF
jgi:hypothetical protein